MSDYRNSNRDREQETGGSPWRPAYQGNRRRRRYVVKRPVYKQPVVWLLAAAAVCILIVCGSLLNWGANDRTQQQIGSNGTVNVGTTPTATPAPNAATSDPAAAESDAAPSSAPTPTPVPTAEPSPTPNEGPLVWDTQNGTSFHFDQNCQGMKNATQETMLAAYNSGKKPCDRCVTSETAIAERPAITVKALTTLPSSLGNVVIQDPQAFDVYDIKAQLGSLGGSPALLVSGSTSGSISLLYTNQPDTYEIRIRAIVTNSAGSVIWDIDGEPVAYTQAGLDMPREISLVQNISTTDILDMNLTVLVYAKDGFSGVDADIAVLGMYQCKMSDVLAS